ncbi:MAG: LysR family transcriptional regulator [Pseudomonadota bacterium]
MTFEQLKTFFWVARLGGFHRASEQLNLSQPAISTRIATLEDALGVKLMERTSKGIRLTKPGTSLLGYAEQILFVQEEIVKRVANTSEVEGLFRIGSSETIAQAWLPDFLKAFSKEFPRVNIDLTVDISGNLRNALLQQNVDLAFLMGPVSEFTVENVALPKFHLHWYKSTATGPVDLRDTPVISYSARTRPYRELMAELTRRIGPNVRVYSSASLSASLQMIAAGIAVGPYPRTLAASLISSGQIEEFDPGFQPNPLEFTASFLGEPRSILAERGAEIAEDIAQIWANRRPH